MPLSTLLNRPCTITRRSAAAERNTYGDEVPSEELVETVCELQQRSRSENAEELSDTRWLLVLPAGTVIGTDDVVTVDGADYELDGDPWPARNPATRAESHVEATLRRAAGPADRGEPGS